MISSSNSGMSSSGAAQCSSSACNATQKRPSPSLSARPSQSRADIYATRLNFYRDNSDWKPWHHDSHAYGGRQQREDFTIGASFGGARALAFLHEPSGIEFSFPQRNGDVFAFDTEARGAGIPGPSLSVYSFPFLFQFLFPRCFRSPW